MLGYLKRCCASVADQERVPFEHIAMDGNSTDGTVEWLGQQRRIAGVVQEDNGMYEAINKGLLLAKGRFVSYLNSDEQYLPDTLNFVREYFDQHPEIDILFGDALLVKPDGSLIAYRKVYQPRWFYIWSSHLYLFSCAMFLRRRIIEEGFQFDERLRVIGDMDFVIRLLCHGYRAAYVRRYLVAFTMTGNNMSNSQNAEFEKKHILDEMAPMWVRSLRLPLNIGRLTEKLISGAYWQMMPLEYALYVSDVTVERRTFRVEKASFRWRTR